MAVLLWAVECSEDVSGGAIYRTEMCEGGAERQVTTLCLVQRQLDYIATFGTDNTLDDKRNIYRKAYFAS